MLANEFCFDYIRDMEYRLTSVANTALSMTVLSRSRKELVERHTGWTSRWLENCNTMSFPLTISNHAPWTPIEEACPLSDLFAQKITRGESWIYKKWRTVPLDISSNTLASAQSLGNGRPYHNSATIASLSLTTLHKEKCQFQKIIEWRHCARVNEWIRDENRWLNVMRA